MADAVTKFNICPTGSRGKTWLTPFFIIFTAILAMFSYIMGLWSSQTVSKCCGSRDICWNQRHALPFFVSLVNCSGCLIYLFSLWGFREFCASQQCHNTSKASTEAGHCFNEEELFDGGGWREVWRRWWCWVCSIKPANWLMLCSTQPALLSAHHSQADGNQSLSQQVQSCSSLHQSTKNKILLTSVKAGSGSYPA